MDSPLCPHCLRSSCPWLGTWKASLMDGYFTPTSKHCPLAGLPLAPNVRRRLLERLTLP